MSFSDLPLLGGMEGDEAPGSGPRGKTAARARHIAAHVFSSPGGRGEGGRFGSFQFHEPPNPRRRVRIPEARAVG